MCAYLCFLLNISLETWAEFSESKIKKLQSYLFLEGELQQSPASFAEWQDRSHPDGEVEMKDTWARGALSTFPPPPLSLRLRDETYTVVQE